jgi:hypothetical protein
MYFPRRDTRSIRAPLRDRRKRARLPCTIRGCCTRNQNIAPYPQPEPAPGEESFCNLESGQSIQSSGVAVPTMR